MGPYLRPRYGIYAVTGRLPDGRVLKGAANLGVRPSFDPPQELLEPHFFDFSGDLYGQDIDVAFHRSEEHTSELQSLMRISYAVFCLKKKKNIYKHTTPH